jgi:hypothetical protein
LWRRKFKVFEVFSALEDSNQETQKKLAKYKNSLAILCFIMTFNAERNSWDG